jgi:hypothetical protein
LTAIKGGGRLPGVVVGGVMFDPAFERSASTGLCQWVSEVGEKLATQQDRIFYVVIPGQLL